MTSQSSEREAIRALKNGDIRGLEPLVRKYQVQAVRAADLITRDQALAEDIVQVAFLRAFKRIEQFNESRPFGPWFLRSVINEAVKTVTRRPETLSLDNQSEISLEEILPASEPQPEEWLEKQETCRRLWEALGQLPPEQRAVIVLHYYLDLNLEEIGEVVAVPFGTIKWRLHKARMRLKKILE
ncbi:MAG TPA: sigma-70 family RNA polymerase sigma factor [Anaerolineales bacterium]|nr:sigma-70 family RNA polymerase sigma factor [Anaerolineales bacterium]